MKKKNLIIVFILFLMIFLGKYYIANNDWDYINYKFSLDSNIKESNIYHFGYIKALNDCNLLHINNESMCNNYINSKELFKIIENEKDLELLQKEFKDIFGGKNLNLSNMTKTENSISKIFPNKKSLFYYSYNLYEFKYLFDKDESGQFWGLNKNSNSLLTQDIKINYFKDTTNYSLSLFDSNDNELIFIKNNNKNIKTYKDLYNYYLQNKNNLNNFILGQDSVIFKNLNFNYNKKDNNIIPNYIINLDININGYGKDLQNNNILDSRENYTFDFTKNTILFIKNKYDINPYLALFYK